MLNDLLYDDGVVVDLRASSKKQLFQELARLASDSAGVASRDIFEAVLQRERLGSTGFGHGVAIPHARLDGLERVRALFARLAEPIEFEAIDDQPVDLVVLLLAPTDAGADHLKALARVSRSLRRQELRDQLRSAPDGEALRALLRERADADAV